MTVLRVFDHSHNPRQVAAQEYELAKEHFKELLEYRDATNPDHQKRFQDALDRQEAARERYIKALSR